MKRSKPIIIPSKKTVLTAVVAVALGTAGVADARADIVSFDFSGLFTMLTPSGTNAIVNTSSPYYDDPTWQHGLRTQISGSMTIDSFTGAGSGTIAPFAFCNTGDLVVHDLTVQAIGNGSGGYGNLILGNG